jgi:hypothetical protein
MFRMRKPMHALGRRLSAELSKHKSKKINALGPSISGLRRQPPVPAQDS